MVDGTDWVGKQQQQGCRLPFSPREYALAVKKKVRIEAEVHRHKNPTRPTLDSLLHKKRERRTVLFQTPLTIP
jgi:gamma-glutamylcyclotransferase (GGCT)/AIG2-like uncharacterized protein YtfP